jgi:hypothetical protein
MNPLSKTIRSIVVRLLVVAGFFVAIGLAASSANAQTGGIEANIPFTFVAAGKTFPAGEYTMIATSNQINIEDAQRKPIALVMANQVSRHGAGAIGRIVFHCYGDRCFLRELWSSTEQNGRQLLTSRMETQLEKEETGKYFAILGKKLPQ